MDVSITPGRIRFEPGECDERPNRGARAFAPWLAAFYLSTLPCAGGASLDEKFAENPLANGWEVLGDSTLFEWDRVKEQLGVTWDSSRPNSYFFHRLPTILSRADDFALAFEVVLSEVRIGVSPGKPFTFQLAIGFLGLRDAVRTDFARGSGINPRTGARNLVEFDYFPDSGFGATVSPTLVSRDNQFAATFSFPLEMAVGARYRVSMRYTAVDQTLRTSMLRDGEPFGPVKDTVLPENFSDFRLEAISINSFSDAGAEGSIRAAGVVDNITVEFPVPTPLTLAAALVGKVWQVSFLSRTNWIYALEASEDLRQWATIGLSLAGTGGVLTLTDESAGIPPAAVDESGLKASSNPIVTPRFYRVRAE